MSSEVSVLKQTTKVWNTLRRTFYNSILAKVMKTYDMSALVQFLGMFNMLTVEGCSETGIFRDLTNTFFAVSTFGNT